MKKKLLIIGMILAMLLLALLVACTKPCEHELETKWDEVNHWQECKLCGEKQDEAAHVLTWVSTDETNHWQVCECGYTTTPAAHADGEDADELCDACGRNLHAHVYALTSDAVNHWEECTCGDKKEATAHVDVKNNENGEDGADGKCDVCNHEIYVVTFDMQGHGAETAVQNVGKGGHAATPATPADDDAWRFGGWYKEAACENAFDFATEVINAATTVYAKWTEDTTEGASKEYAYALTLGENNFQDIGQNQVVYFVYTATNAGRFTAWTLSAKCTFTTDKTEGTYNNETDAYFDLAQNEKVYVALTCTEELEEGAKASVAVDYCTNEPLTDDVFPSGEYANSSYTLEFNHSTKEITFNDNTYFAKYVGGKVNTLTFVIEMGIGQQTFSLTPNSDGTYNFTINSNSYTLRYVVPQPPVALSEIVGYYEPTENAYISELYIYAGTETSTSVRVLQNNYYSDLFDATYDTEKNQLTFNYNKITLNLTEDGAVESITLNEVTYERKGELGAVPPAKLPIAITEYNGESYTIRTQYGSQYFGANGYNAITVMNYAKDTGKYTINVSNSGNFTQYQLTISEDGLTIELYDAEGEKLDTLITIELVIPNLPVNGEEQTINVADIKDDYYWYKVAESGWYTITVEADTIVYYGLAEVDPDNAWTGEQCTGSNPVKLVENTYVALNIGNYWPVPETITITVTEADEPFGMSENKPIDLVDGSYTFNDMDNINTYYFRYQGLKANSYIVGCTYNDWGTLTSVHYLINGNEYGRVLEGWSFVYYGGVTADNPYAAITIDEETDLIIAVDRIGSYGTETVTVIVARDFSNATEITEDSGTLEAGIYKLAELTGVESITLTTTEGEIILSANQIKLGFEVETEATYVVNYAIGTEKNPVIITGVGTTEVHTGQYVTITAPSDTDVILALGNAGELEFCFTYNDENYGYYSPDQWNFYALDKTTLSISAGETVTVYVFCNGYPVESEVPVIIMEDYIKGSTEIEFVNGTPENDKLTASATVSENGVYYIDTTLGSDVTVTSDAAFTITLLSINGEEEIVAKEKDGVYTATISAPAKLYFRVALKENLTLSVEYAKGSEGYPEAIELVEGTVDIELASRQILYITLPAGTYTFAHSGNYVMTTIQLNGTQISFNEAVDVSADDVLMLVCGRSAETITISTSDDEPVVPTVEITYRGLIGTGDMQRNATLAISADWTSVVYTITDNFGGDPEVSRATLSSTGEGNDIEYSFMSSSSSGDNVTFTVSSDGNSISINDDYYGAGTLTKQA